MRTVFVQRTCKNCLFLKKAKTEFVCYEGGFTEIGEPDKVMTEEDCNAWRLNIEPLNKLMRCI